MRSYLLKFASQPQFFAKYVDWRCNSAANAEDAKRLLRVQCEGLGVGDTALQSAALQGIAQIWRQWKVITPAIDEALAGALKSATIQLQLRVIFFAIYLNEARALADSTRKAAFGASVNVAEAVCQEPPLFEDRKSTR